MGLPCGESSVWNHLEPQYDVIVLGAGPAGLVLATWMARTGVSTLLVEPRRRGVLAGRADGLESRSLEMLESFGLVDQIWNESNRTVEVCFWGTPGGNSLERLARKCNFKRGVSRFQETTLAQGRVEEVLLEDLRKYQNITVLNGVAPLHLDMDRENRRGSKVSLYLRPLGLEKNNNELVIDERRVEAKYLVGCDGAHSWTRSQLGGRLKQVRSGSLWGAIDLVPDTDFPDFRCRCIIRAATGTMMIIPREKGLIRMYVPLNHLGVQKSAVTSGMVLQSAQELLIPYYLRCSEVKWWTAYEVKVSWGVSDIYSSAQRIFLAGDAVHVHSPKTGQGMNVSMQDAYNLGWKLAQVVKGMAGPELLDTYESERRPVAEQLTAFDAQFNDSFSNPSHKCPESLDREDDTKIWLNRILAGVEQEHDEAAPTSVSYFEEMMQVLKRTEVSQGLRRKISRTSEVATNVEIGQRLRDVPVVCHADARTWPVLKLLPSNGQWRLVIFGGDISQADIRKRLESLSTQLVAADGLLSQDAPDYCSVQKPRSQVMAVLLCHAAPRSKIELLSLPAIFRPHHPEQNQRNSVPHKVFCDDAAYDPEAGNAYDKCGVDPSKGALVLVRPDQVVAWVCRIEDIEEMQRVFVAQCNL